MTRKLSVDPAMSGRKPLKRRWWHRFAWRRKEPTTFQRCLAVHMHFAENMGALR